MTGGCDWRVLLVRHSLKAWPLKEDDALDESPGDAQGDDVMSGIEGTPNAEVAPERALDVERASGDEGVLHGEVVSVVDAPSVMKDTVEAIRTSGDVERTLDVDAGRTLALEGTFDVECTYDVGGTSGFESTFVVQGTRDGEGTFVAEDNRGVDPIAVCL